MSDLNNSHEKRAGGGVLDYGDVKAEYEALTAGAAVVDHSMRGRICLTGADRTQFLHGQVTNNVRDLAKGRGCHAAVVNAKGKLQGDLNIFNLGDELLLDFEAGLTGALTERFEKFIIAEDVQVIDAAPHYALLSVLGPEAPALLARLGVAVPEGDWRQLAEGERYVARLPRHGLIQFDLYLPVAEAGDWMSRLTEAGARPCGFTAIEQARIERGAPRFGVDMTEENLAPEALGEGTISYNKGCYIGQEVIARIRTYGQVAKALRGLRLPPGSFVPIHGDKVFLDAKEVGWITSATESRRLGAPVALGYIRKECNQPGTRLRIHHDGRDETGEVALLPLEP